MPETEEKKRGPTETLMYVLERFGESEASSVLVLWTDVNGRIHYEFNHDMMISTAVGLAELFKQDSIHQYLSRE